MKTIDTIKAVEELYDVPLAKVPKTVIVVSMREFYFQCVKALLLPKGYRATQSQALSVQFH